MNSKIKSAIAKYEGKILIQDYKKAIEFLVNCFNKTKVIMVSDSAFYLRTENRLIAVSEKEVFGIIRTMIDSSSRAKISSLTIKETVERLRDMPDVQIDIDKIIEKNKYKVLLKNGSFDVKEKKFTPSPPKDELYLYKLNFNYIKNASLKSAPNFKSFVSTSLGEENLDCFLEWTGYSCTLITDARRSMFFIGPEKCGKSLTIELMEDGLGIENTSSVVLDLLRK